MKPRQPEIISRCQFRQTRSLSNRRKSILEDERSFTLLPAFSFFFLPSYSQQTRHR
jgi:hypothetical protein